MYIEYLGIIYGDVLGGLYVDVFGAITGTSGIDGGTGTGTLHVNLSVRYVISDPISGSAFPS